MLKNNTNIVNDIRETNYVTVNNIIWYYLWQVDYKLYPWEFDWYTSVDHDVEDQWEYVLDSRHVTPDTDHVFATS